MHNKLKTLRVDGVIPDGPHSAFGIDPIEITPPNHSDYYITFDDVLYYKGSHRLGFQL